MRSTACAMASPSGTIADMNLRRLIAILHPRLAVVAHDLATGKLRWYTPRNTAAEAEQFDSYTTPVYRKAGDGTTEMIIMGGNQLDAYDP